VENANVSTIQVQSEAGLLSFRFTVRHECFTRKSKASYPFQNSHSVLRRSVLRVWNRIGVLASIVWLSAAMFAAEIKGTVTNATTKKPAAGDEVVVMSLAGGMEEVGHGNTDTQGRLPFPCLRAMRRIWSAWSTRA
jgi:hypothetical protein